MSSNLVAITMFLAILAVVACSADPKSGAPCCRDEGHRVEAYGEVGYCPTRGY